MQVLGMINNYQRDAGEEDDRDSGSLTVLTPLSQGDQVRGGKYKKYYKDDFDKCFHFLRFGWNGEDTEIHSFTVIPTS